MNHSLLLVHQWLLYLAVQLALHHHLLPMTATFPCSQYPGKPPS
uniref:Uncharacterized protein n=1 Tax=Arundo donax TaxID=35708 RepID=A0A0A8XNP2_ARUDO